MSDPIQELFDYISFKAEKIPTDLRLLLFTKNILLRVYYGRVVGSIGFPEYSAVSSLKCERGRILDVFAKLEFIVNEIIQIELLGPSSGKKGIMLDNVLGNVDFFSRIRILRKWKIIDDPLKNSLIETKQVRDGLAHRWDEKEVYYKEKPLVKCFDDFKKDMLAIQDEIFQIYNKRQQKIDAKKILDELKSLNKK